jgi:hypothetical protein
MRSMTEMICGPSGVRESINEQRRLGMTCDGKTVLKCS